MSQMIMVEPDNDEWPIKRGRKPEIIPEDIVRAAHASYALNGRAMRIHVDTPEEARKITSQLARVCRGMDARYSKLVTETVGGYLIRFKASPRPKK